jgi:hypothetical protein
MTMLTYTVLTDPAPLEASEIGRSSPSTGTVYLVVANTGKKVRWSTIKVTVPVGNGAGDLTPSIGKINPKGEYTDTRSGTQTVNVQPQGTDILITPQTGKRASFRRGGYMVLTLENITVAPTAGLVVLTVAETTGKSGGEITFHAAVPLVKTAAKEIPAPRDFRPDKTMLDVTDNLALSWEGSPEFTYAILFPGGQVKIPSNTRTWSPAAAPKRATTYTLVATDPITQKQHFLTTTVQVRHPVLETLTATIGIDTPWVQGASAATKGRVTFTGTGVDISNSSGQGTVTADAAHFNTVTTPWVGGPNSGDGTITFPQGGLMVWRTGGSQAKGTVFADKADLNGVNTEWVQGRSAGDGRITFPKEGLNIYQGSGAAGTVTANYADLDIVKTRVVRGREAADGWISFRTEGLNIHQERGTKPGTLFANYADLDIVKTRVVRGRKDDDGWISFRKEGLNVRRERGNERGTLFAAKTELSG